MQGETYEETLSEIKSAIKAMIEDYLEDREKIPSGDVSVTTVKVAV